MNTTTGAIYQADIYCEGCAAALRAQLDAEGKRPASHDDHGEWDSDDYPLAVDVTEEADAPQHCAACGEFLENQLTDEGASYVAGALRRYSKTQRGNCVVLDLWANAYEGCSRDMRDAVRIYRAVRFGESGTI